MKILQINNCGFRRGGADIAFLNTTALLKKKGHEVFTFSLQDEKNIYTENEQYFVSFPDIRNLGFVEKAKRVSSFLYNREAYSKLLSLLDELKPQIAHLHLFLGGLSSSILKALAERNIPIVISVHDYRLICPAYLLLDGENKICEKCKNQFYLNCVINRCSEGNLFQSLVLSMDAYFRKYRINPVSYIHRFIFVSNFIKKKHIEFNPVFAEKGTFLYNFVPDLKNIYPLKKKGGYFLFLGRLSREKGVDTLLNAALNTGVNLKVVGTGSLFEKYAGKNYPNIDILGAKFGNELNELLRNASFLVVPSEWYENNPLIILEAYSHGKPVIASRIGGIPEIVRPNDTGFLFEAKDREGLEKLLLQAASLPDQEYERMSGEARKFADNHFEEDNHYSQLLSIYEEVIGSHLKHLN